ncbi:hypothetical protein ACFQ4C_04245 [Larkinella insperata]|uniref:Uncharacterized protein n=1 Tax=Larkinella insperata TaxID=332158 RepID=A0ABW3Q3B4_9BACT|nr:hypothetical protein [Larkinella insperata]
MKHQRIPYAPKFLALNVTHSFRILLLRRLNQVFWLLLLMGLTAWGAWRFCQLAPSTTPRRVAPATTELQRHQLQSISSLDSSVTVLRMAVMTDQSETILLGLTEGIRQQAHEVTLLTDADDQLMNHCLALRQSLQQKASTRFLSKQIADLQSHIRYLHHQTTGTPAE